jgi:hypothetical protein
MAACFCQFVIRNSLYQTLQILSGAFVKGAPWRQEKAAENSGMFARTPLILVKIVAGIDRFIDGRQIEAGGIRQPRFLSDRR